MSDYPSLAGLLGSYYGGDGISTFAIPDLRGRVVIGSGTGTGLSPRGLGQFSGFEEVTLAQTQIPVHNHTITNNPTVTHGLTVTGSATMKCANTTGNSSDPSGAFMAKTATVSGDNIYTNDAAKATVNMNSNALDVTTNLNGNIGVEVDSSCGMTGAGLAHENMQPWFCLNYIINFDGVFPNR